ncbi:MAG TPA: hypothetical protein VMU95_32960 [Trebonia sp.]|nr:hypothetical protein [Trebonia sp.]
MNGSGQYRDDVATRAGASLSLALPLRGSTASAGLALACAGLALA